MRLMSAVLPDLLRPGLRAVFCGTAAGTASALRRAYYAGPGNRFWPTLHAVGLTPRLMAPEEYPLLLDLGLGLTDLCKDQSGQDATLRFTAEAAAALRRRILRHRPALLAFTSKTAARHALGLAEVAYGLQPATIGATRLFVLPSPSGAARASWSEQPWRALAMAARSPSHSPA